MFSWRTPHPRPIVVAHRGDSGSAPENTLAAFARAINAGAHAIELDVRLTADGRVVVFHDGRLARTAGGRGLVSDTSSAVIRRLSAGAWFSEEFADEKVPFLEEALAVAAGKAGVNIELKFNSRRQDPGPLVRAVSAIVADFRPEEILVSSFHHCALEFHRSVAPGIDRGVLLYPPGVPAGSGVRVAGRTGAKWVIYSGGNIRPAFIAKARAAGLKTMEYTVNTRGRFRRSLRMGVDGVITNEPAAMVSAPGY